MNLIFALVHFGIAGLELLIVITALMSWFPGALQSKFGQWATQMSDLIVEPVRKVMPRTGMLDFSPLIAILILEAAELGLRMLSQMF
ncbi:YggT family protein [Weissella coleopterorum]|uniref:YggT family protein n=1 Tax=Weissella coleopterorum TaxID=2714949 RepID=A0A6G8AZQ4_9LACO|nr:YggT family protein [Weissella coleopterorum]QIL50544.1 YggT family protein [Weissella coleopterorum]